MRRILAMLLLSGSLVPRPASAEPVFVTHTFDGRAAGVQGYFAGNLFLSSLAPRFTTNNIEIVASPLAVSAPNLVRPWSPGAVLEGRFLLNEAPHITLATGLLFFEVTGPRPSSNPYTIELFGRDGTLLDSFSGTIPQGWGFVRRKGPMIHFFRFTPGDPGHGLDDVRYTAPVVPEPATMILVGTGLAAACLRRGRRR